MNADALQAALYCLIVWALLMMPLAWRIDQDGKR